VVQTLTIVQYFAQERLNAWKDVSWELLSQKSKSKQEKELVVVESQELENLENKIPSENGNDEHPIKEEEVGDGKMTDRRNSEHIGNEHTSAMTFTSYLNPEEKRQLNMMLWKIKFARFFVSDVFKVFIVIISYIVSLST
jgi:hypothetical protein